ncbi:uncharacterized protein F4822DRAFT_406297 [Hypoxylon trugodes]|uniref:uncharacterized protein n=1 Tax=Hypoxylon trugodes TaxID=326681 RepID=UPI00218CCF7F|nr:uncharacterized protein F4822DRAFT_406297 [Hypoxylon trugodes]KAI1387389.1 hypothetical protein F4822DRAFT_406297 [Hypoxylon trugodes]
MCSLAYQILHRSRSTFLLDLRHFHQRFTGVFGERSGRCIGNKACSGLGPDDCKRIRGAKVVDQSQHDLSCTDRQACNRIKWDKSSYLTVSGARAVSISSTSDQLRYQAADTATLAISHVWSHGQGGRPEDGLNQCLHQRYCNIAKKFNCTSYWIDAACIPCDHILRREAILTINQVFSTSHATILCDRDVMDIDISIIQDESDTSDASVALMESILTIVLVCDWNVRAWTLLEALRGRKNIQLLCKSSGDNRLISLTDILRNVTYHGDISISILLLTNHHLFPAPGVYHWIKFKTSSRELPFQSSTFDSSHDAQLTAGRMGRGFITVSEAASLLGQRFASRPGDDVIIWSLLVDDPVRGNAEDLWTRGKDGTRLDQVVYTGHLLSSVQRLPPKSYPRNPSWAPKQPGPYLAANEKSPISILYPPYDGSQSRVGTIEIKGFEIKYLRANWGVASIRFKNKTASSYRGIHSSGKPMDNEPIPDKLGEYFEGCYDGILLHPLQRVGAQGEVEGFEESYANIYGGYRSITKGLLLAVCGRIRMTSSEGTWTWLGVIDWGDDTTLPYFEEKEILLE